MAHPGMLMIHRSVVTATIIIIIINLLGCHSTGDQQRLTRMS